MVQKRRKVGAASFFPDSSSDEPIEHEEMKDETTL
jgi:hypothetical protein